MDNERDISREKHVIERVEKGHFIKGKSANPNGRPKGSSYIAELKQAIKEVEKDKKSSFLKRVIERAWYSDSVMIAVLKKFIPDKLRQEFEGLENIKLVIEHVAKKNKGNKSL